MIKIAIAACLIFASFVTSAVYYLTQQPEINYSQGHKLFEAGKFIQAIPYFNKALAIQPEKIKALRELSYSYHWTKQYQAAIETFNKALAIQPRNQAIKKSLAQAYYWMGDFPSAIRLFSQLLKETGEPGLKLDLAEIYLWNKQYREAKELVTGFLAEYPDELRATIILAKALQYSGDYQRGILVCKELLTKKGLKLEDRYELEDFIAEAAMIMKDYDTSISMYKNILERDPANIKARMRLADILSWRGSYDESIEEFKRILKEEPDNMEAKKKLAAVYTWNNDYAQAQTMYIQIIKQDPADTLAYNLLWESMIIQKKYSEAIIFFDAVISRKGNKNILPFYVKQLVLTNNYQHAKEILKNTIDWNTAGLEDREYFADLLSYNGDYLEAISNYEDILKRWDEIRIKNKLADVLSWDKQYQRAISLYDDILAMKEDQQVKLQKARVLGWAKQYSKSLAEYQKIVGFNYDELVALEMQAKRFYWDSRIKQAIGRYSLLILKDPLNTEAIFDLSQIYSYQSMWQEASVQYDKILNVYPNHFRAKEGRQKAKLLRKGVIFKTGYEFLEQDSASRDMDLKKASFFNRLTMPLDDHLSVELQHYFSRRNFSDFCDVDENDVKLKIAYINNPDYWLDAFYNHTVYNKDIRQMHTFGTSQNLRVLDMGILSFSQERLRLENNSIVLADRRYRDNYKGRLSLDVNKKFKAGLDYLYSWYSDRNSLRQPGLDLLYFFSLDPKRLSLKYRYFCQNYQRKLSDYFSPKWFYANSLSLNWRHFLNKNEIFFGADDKYYDLGYEITCDSSYIVSHKFSAELGWDVSKRLSLNMRGSATNSSSNVYMDKNIVVSVKYCF